MSSAGVTLLATLRGAKRVAPKALPPSRWFACGKPWVFAALAGLASAGLPAQALDGGRSGTLRLTAAGRHVMVRVALARADVDALADHVVTSLGTRGRFLLLLDSYASRPQPLARCGAGHESWVRLIDLPASAERWSRRVESCRHDLSPGIPAAMWKGTGTTFEVHLLPGPDLHLHVGQDGQVAPAGTAVGAGPTHPAWLVGTWDVQDPSRASRADACRLGTDQVAFSRQGYWIGIAVGDYGSWRLSGRTLFETQLKAGAGERLNRPHTWSATVEQVGSAEIRLHKGNATTLMVRCDRDADAAFPKGLRH